MTATDDATTSPSMGEQVAAWAYLAGWRTIRLAPERVARAAFNQLADRLWQRRIGGVDMLERNLRQVVGPEMSDDDLRALSRRGTRAYLQYWCDAFRLPSMSTEQIHQRVSVDNFDQVVAAMDSGRGAVLALTHSGNWDLVGAWLASEHGEFTTIAERLRPERLHEQFVDYRRSLGMEVLPLDGGRHVMAKLGTRLRSGGIVCLMADRDFGGNGVPVTLFGKAASLPAGPASLATSTGADLFPVEVWVEQPSGQLRAVVHPAIRPDEGLPRSERVAAMTRDLATCFEQFIADHPQDWHMMQRIWANDDMAEDDMADDDSADVDRAATQRGSA